MSITKTREKVRDAFLGDLPPDLQTKVMNIHKLIKDTVRDILDEDNYEDLKKSSWAMSCIDEFCVMPKDKTEVGSARVYKSGKTYRCMIQATGHFTNHQYGWIEELLHDFIGNVYTTVRPKIRKKYDMTITNEGRTGEPFEGFDIYPNPKSVKDIWDSLDDRKTKTITEGVLDIFKYPGNSQTSNNKEGKLEVETNNPLDLPNDFARYLILINEIIVNTTIDIANNDRWKNLMRDYIDELSGKLKNNINVLIEKKGDLYNTFIKVADGFFDGEGSTSIDRINNRNDFDYIWEDYNSFHQDVMTAAEKKFPPKLNYVTNVHNAGTYCVGTVVDVTDQYARYLWNYINKSSDNLRESSELDDYYEFYSNMSYDDYFYERSHGRLNNSFRMGINKENDHRQGRGYIREAASSDTPEYNVSMSEREAKKTLATLSQSIINDIANKKGYKVSQYTANIYANIITKNLLPLWAKGFRKFTITLDTYQSFCTFEFKVPAMTQDFVARFVNGRESLNGFIHRQSEIKVKMSPNIFHTMKDANDAYSFFKAAIKYYDSSLERYGNRMMIDVLKLNHEMKYLISTTKLSGLVVYPLSLLFKFDDVKMDDRDVFRITPDDVKTISQFMRSIYTRYADPNKEKKRIVDDVQEMVKALRECSDTDDVNMRSLTHFPEAVDTYLSGGFDKVANDAHEEWIKEHVDGEWTYHNSDPQIKYLQEKFGVKKLKKIPTDLVAYISIETEAIKDANDKMMISSYCLGKIEIVEWYIELLDVGSKKYIVPHTKPYLEGVRTQLLACFKKIMDIPIPQKDKQPLIDIQYPKGYEG